MRVAMMPQIFLEIFLKNIRNKSVAGTGRI
jgi:hypothetical protein